MLLKKDTSAPAGKVHYMVKQNEGPRTTATYAKFRSLSSRSVDIWFENGAGGSFQGTIRPGQQTTTNAYDGHVFYFTESGNKDKVLLRVTIRPSQVSFSTCSHI